MRYRATVLLGLVLIGATAQSATAQDDSWKNRWYWGAQGGLYLFSANGAQEAFAAGGHWFITAGSSALYLAYDQLIMPTAVTGAALSTGQTVNFDSGNRLQAIVYAIPNDNKAQIYLGGGFGIHRITNATLNTGLGGTQDLQQIEDASTKAFLIMSGGLQLRYLPGIVLFGQYQFIPSAEDFAIRSQQHSFNVGIRIGITNAKEVVTAER